MIWWNKRQIDETPDDIAEAKRMRREADTEMAELMDQAAVVRKLTQTLIDRRAANHFGDSIQITFVRR